jgi:hypothetical protein
MQHVTSLSFLLLAYSNYLSHANKAVPCGETSATPALLRRLAKRQVNSFSPIAQFMAMVIGGPSIHQSAFNQTQNQRLVFIYYIINI